MIDIIERLRTVLHNFDPNIEINNISLSFVEHFQPHYANQSYLVLYKNAGPLKTSPKGNFNVPVKEVEPRLDITGSPLEYSFAKDNFDETIIEIRNNWKKEEENYLPLSKSTASNALNLCLAHLNGQCELPIFALCDCQDNDSTILMGAIDQEEWFTTVHISYRGVKRISEVRHECASKRMIQEHRIISYAQEHQVNVSLVSVFELFGKYEDTKQDNANVRKGFEGSLSIVANSQSLIFDLPLIGLCDRSLVIQIVAGKSNSLLSQLWKQVILLDQHLRILNSYKCDIKFSQQYSVIPLEFPKDFSPSYTEDYEKTVKKLNHLLSGDLSFRTPQSSSVSADNINDLQKYSLENVDIKLKEHIEHMFFRPTLDFTDYLWELLGHIKSHTDMTDCLCNVFENTLKNGYQPELIPTNNTRFVQALKEINEKLKFSHMLLGSIPLQIITDMGLEKLTRDYMYLLMTARLIDGNSVRNEIHNISRGDYVIEEYRKRLTTLAQIHICVELVLFVQTHLNCSTGSLQSLFEYAFKKIVHNGFMAQSFNELQQNTIFTFTFPIANNSLFDEEAHKGSPSMWRATINSENQYSKWSTTTHYSKAPIFPPNLCPPPAQDEEDYKETIFYASQATILSNKCFTSQ